MSNSHQREKVGGDQAVALNQTRLKVPPSVRGTSLLSTEQVRQKSKVTSIQLSLARLPFTYSALFL